MTDADSFRAIVAARVEELGGNISSLEYRASLPPDSIRNVLRSAKGAGPTISKAQDICRALGLELYVGPPRVDEAISFQAQKSERDFAFVPRYDVELSAGPGASGSDGQQIAAVAFRKDWLNGNGLRADKCVVCGVKGDSMEPLLFEGDLVLLDRQRRKVRDGEVYGLVDADGEVKIKRIEKVEHGIVLRSDNRSGPTVLRLGEDANAVRIIGSLAWAGHTFNDIALTGARSRSKEPPFDMDWVD